MNEENFIPEFEKRLHRVKIILNKDNIKCTYSKSCTSAENCYRCNIYYNKCVIYIKNSVNAP
jgi:hypothetical protein